MRVMVIGGGGREHALAWGLSTSSGVDGIVAVPGNPGIESLVGAKCVSVEDSSPKTLADLAESESIDLTVVGPEDLLVDGIADYFDTRGLRIFGPRRAPARLEGSKSFAKSVMDLQGVPTARSKSFASTDGADTAKAFLETMHGPWVVKADGLAAGKGVLVTDEISEATAWVDDCLESGRFGTAGASIIIEEFLDGPELSLLVLCDGRDLVPLAPARDHKRLLDDDQGPNTGGMGAYSPVPGVDEKIVDQVMDTIIEPVQTAMSKEGDPIVGVLYAGLVLTGEGPKVLEFNVRFGDPEAQAVIPRLESDLAELCLACTEGRLGQTRVKWKEDACVTVVAAADGYPESPRKGDPIEGLDVAADERALVFQAGTTSVADNGIVTSGGRVLAVSGLGSDLAEARQSAYNALGQITFSGMQYRSDIAASAAEEAKRA